MIVPLLTLYSDLSHCQVSWQDFFQEGQSPPPGCSFPIVWALPKWYSSYLQGHMGAFQHMVRPLAVMHSLDNKDGNTGDDYK